MQLEVVGKNEQMSTEGAGEKTRRNIANLVRRNCR